VVLEQPFFLLLSRALCVSVFGAVSGPGSRDFRSLVWSGGALVCTGVDLLLFARGTGWKIV